MVTLTRGVLRCIVVEGTFGDDLEGRKGPGGLSPRIPTVTSIPATNFSQSTSPWAAAVFQAGINPSASCTIESPIVDPPCRGLTTSG